MTSIDRAISNISIIIPTLNEQTTLGRQLSFLQQYPGLEILVVDGGSKDQTPDIANYYGARLVRSEPGRGCQQNLGADLASRDTLLFVHSDTTLPVNFPVHVNALLSRPKIIAGAFGLKIDATGFGFRIIEWGANYRSKLFTLIYGDQAIFLRKEIFTQAGGFPNQMIMEDIGFVLRLRKYGRIQLAPACVVTSARRWKNLGLLKTTILNQLMLAGFFFKVNPEKLGRLYYRKSVDN